VKTAPPSKLPVNAATRFWDSNDCIGGSCPSSDGEFRLLGQIAQHIFLNRRLRVRKRIETAQQNYEQQ
jgi:hypothetical protein